MENIFINTHSSIKIVINDLTFYFDPFMINEDKKDADFILITHDHYDHFDIKSIKRIINQNTTIVYPKTICSVVKKEISNLVFRDEILVKQSDKFEFTLKNEKFSVVSIPAYNINKSFHKKEFGYVGYILEINETKYYVAGDTDVIDENKNIKCEIMFIPIGGTYTMDYIEAAKYVNSVNPKKVIPTHYGSVVGDINLGNKFRDLIDKKIETIILIK